MSVQGMDIQQVRSLASTFAKAATTLDGAASQLDAELARAPWRGPDAVDFRGDWNSSHRAALHRTATSLREVSRVLLTQAAQQDGASRADGGSATASGAGKIGTNVGGSPFGGTTATGTGSAQPSDFFGSLAPIPRTITGLVPGLQDALGDLMDVAMRNDAVEEAISTTLGFEYQGPDQDFYTTNQTSIQSHLGFMDAFDDLGFVGGMDLDESISEFSYGGREYRLELWKGSYGSGSAFGGEIGFYIRDPARELWDSPGQAIDGFYPAAEPADRIPMTQTIYDPVTGEEYFTNARDDSYWNLAIRTEPGLGPADLAQRGSLQVDDVGLRNAMVAAMEEEGLQVSVDPRTGNIVYVWE